MDSNKVLLIITIVFSIFTICSCGSIENRLIGGQNTPIEQVPYVVALETLREGQRCGASVIASNYVLTAASCIIYFGANWTEFRIRGGSATRNEGGVVKTLKNFYINYNRDVYRPNNGQNDIIILELTTPFDLSTNKIKAINLPAANETLPTGTRCTVSGWGATRNNGPPSLVLQSTAVQIVDHTTCQNSYQPPLLPVTNKMICAGSTSTCQGDSGAPLVANNKQFGIASQANTCAQLPGVYTDVRSYREWIRQTAKV